MEQDTRKYYTLTMTSTIHEYEDVVTYKFYSQEPVPFEPGQYVHLVSPDSEVDPATVRHMSVASSPADPELVFSMEHRSGSGYKQRFASLRPGQTIRMFGIKGQFVLDPEIQKDVVFIAGGIGITPIRSLIRSYCLNGSTINWSLIHVSRSEYLYRDELEQLDAPQYRVRRETFSNALEAVLRPTSAQWFYISGSDPFVDGIRAILARRMIPATRIKTERFE
jgi:ferredoxin-NADP reductase